MISRALAVKSLCVFNSSSRFSIWSPLAILASFLRALDDQEQRLVPALNRVDVGMHQLFHCSSIGNGFGVLDLYLMRLPSKSTIATISEVICRPGITTLLVFMLTAPIFTWQVNHIPEALKCKSSFPLRLKGLVVGSPRANKSAATISSPASPLSDLVARLLVPIR